MLYIVQRNLISIKQFYHIYYVVSLELSPMLTQYLLN